MAMKGGGVTATTYAELKALRDAGQLKAGAFYRITDYMTTTTQENTQSAGHAFDLIVLALNERTLCEEAKAVVHEGDTYFTEAGANIAAWKVWYCLDNNETRFAWADAENGKGVIYRMIDEFGNDIPYDFKNLIYDIPLTAEGEIKKYGGWYTASVKRLTESDTIVAGVPYYAWKGEITAGPSGEAITYSLTEDLADTTLYDINGDSVTESEVMRLSSVKQAVRQYTFNDEDGRDGSLTGVLTDIVMKPYYPGSTKTGVQPNFILIGQRVKQIFFGANCRNITIGTNCSNITFGDGCNNITFGNACSNNTFGNACSNNTFGNNCSSNTFGANCSSNTFGNACSNNTFGANCSYNTFGANYSNNTFGDACNNNTFANTCINNTFGNACSYNTFGNGCDSNKFGDRCQYNDFGNACLDAQLGANNSRNQAGLNSNGEVVIKNLFDE